MAKINKQTLNYKQKDISDSEGFHTSAESAVYNIWSRNLAYSPP